MKINQMFTFLHNTTYYPSLGDISDYFLTTDAELRAALTDSFFASLKAIVDYDSTPAQWSSTTDTRYIVEYRNSRK